MLHAVTKFQENPTQHGGENTWGRKSLFPLSRKRYEVGPYTYYTEDVGGRSLSVRFNDLE